MKKPLLLSAFCFLFAVPFEAIAQTYTEREDLEFRRVRVTLVPGLSTNGMDAPKYTARYSYNLIAGYHGGLDGYEIGPLNINKYYMHGVQLGLFNVTAGTVTGVQISGLGTYTDGNMNGVQFSGLGNITGGHSQGLMFSGMYNISRGSSSGIQMAGMFNMSGHSIEGIQVSGLANVARYNIEGVQVSGLANIASNDIQGIQVSGLLNSSGGSTEGIVVAGLLNLNGRSMEGVMVSGGVNLAKSLEGLAISGLINSGRNMSGLQVAGLANISDRSQGLQMGLINIARDFEGLPIGLVSLYGNGRKNIEIWTNETGFTHTGIKLGTRQVYNMISVGYNPFISDRDVWSVGWSIGSYRTLDYVWNQPRLENYYRTRDFSITKIQDGEWSSTLNTLYSYKLIYGRNFSGGFSLFAGPTFNMLASRQDGHQDYVPYTLYKRSGGERDTRFWIGFTAGIQFFRH